MNREWWTARTINRIELLALLILTSIAGSVYVLAGLAAGTLLLYLADRVRNRQPTVTDVPDEITVPAGVIRFTRPVTEADAERIRRTFLRGGPIGEATFLPALSREWIDAPLHPELFEGPPRPPAFEDDQQRTLDGPEPSSGPTDPKGSPE